MNCLENLKTYDQIKELVEQNVELVKAKDQNGTTPLHHASSGKYLVPYILKI